MARIKPIPDDTWLRLAAMEPRCSLSMWRAEEWLIQGAAGKVWSILREPGATERRMSWRVRIGLNEPGTGYGGLVDASEPHLADALLAAAALAESYGWHRPKPTRPVSSSN